MPEDTKRNIWKIHLLNKHLLLYLLERQPLTVREKRATEAGTKIIHSFTVGLIIPLLNVTVMVVHAEAVAGCSFKLALAESKIHRS